MGELCHKGARAGGAETKACLMSLLAWWGLGEIACTLVGWDGMGWGGMFGDGWWGPRVPRRARSTIPSSTVPFTQRVWVSGVSAKILGCLGGSLFFLFFFFLLGRRSRNNGAATEEVGKPNRTAPHRANERVAWRDENGTVRPVQYRNEIKKTIEMRRRGVHRWSNKEQNR